MTVQKTNAPAPSQTNAQQKPAQPETTSALKNRLKNGQYTGSLLG